MMRRMGWMGMGMGLMLAGLIGCGNSPQEVGALPPPTPLPAGETPASGTSGMGPTSPTHGAAGYPAPSPSPTSKAAEADMPKATEPAKPADEPKKDDAPKTADVTLTPEEVAEIKKLPEAEQVIALAQKVCPVGDGHLGDPDMGLPYKKVVDGKTVFLCCKGCEKAFDKDLAKYLAKAAPAAK